ncbi:MAG: PEGA domain-containing protein, partial [Myxococcales bacterium]|nr:PEGA domain-containing protein [Myxococcales bacterium]
MTLASLRAAPAPSAASSCVRRGRRHAWWAALVVGAALSVTPVAGVGALGRARAQSTDNAEARAFFDQGNRAFERSQRATGARRVALLEEALAAYVASLSVVRSKNALFNAGVTLAALGRSAEAYSYFGEYLALPGLSAEERAAADAQRAALMSGLMMVSVRSTPAGAEVRVDRADLGVVGRTPVEVPLSPGEHVLLLRADGYEDAAVLVVSVAGARGEVAAVMVGGE